MAFNPFSHKVRGEFKYRGILYFALNKGLDLHLLDSYNPDASDVLLATYPKTGTTWMGAILPLILHDGNMQKILALGSMEMSCPYIELNVDPAGPPSLDIIKSHDPPRAMKTHLRYEFFKEKIEGEAKLKTVIMFRNPKDTFVSYYHFYRMNRLLGSFLGSFDEWFELAKVGQVMYGDLFDWYKDWWSHKDQDNIMVVKYEEMVQDTLGTIHKVAKFCGKELDDDIILKIAEQCSFKQMKQAFASSVMFSHMDNSISPFFRKGKVGSWKDEMSKEQSQWVDDKCKQILAPIGLKFDFEI